jgi:hypothetical protein
MHIVYQSNAEKQLQAADERRSTPIKSFVSYPRSSALIGG